MRNKNANWPWVRRRAIAALVALAASASAGAPAKPQAVATVSHLHGRWTVDYRFDRAAAAWVFPVSAPTLDGHAAWRATDWRVLTPGVAIVRRGEYDVLVPRRSGRLPRRIRIAFTPTNRTLDREYDPAVAFSNGATALYSDQFDVAEAQDAASVTTRPAGLSITDLGGSPAPVRFHDAAGPVFVRDRLRRDAVLTGAQTYVVFGAARVEQGRDLAILADPALPAWLTREATAFAPGVARTYAARLGPSPDGHRPLLLMGWRGPTRGKVVTDGGVRPGEVLMNFAGEGLLDRNEKAARRTRWFIAHEFAHFWLGTSGVAARTPGDAWITEGGAEMMAFSLLAADDRGYALSELQRAVDDCAALARKPVAGAGDRHDSRAPYACGTVFALAATGVMRRTRGDWFDFVRPLLARGRTDGRVGAADWLASFAEAGGDGEAVAAIHVMLERGSPDAPGAIRALLVRSGVAVSGAGDRLVLEPTAI